MAEAGFQTVPDVLIRNQALLKLSPLELAVLLNITMFWWRRETKPRISTAKTSERIGVEEHEVEQAIEALVEKKIIRRIKDEEGRRAFDLEPLVQKLALLAEFEEVE